MIDFHCHLDLYPDPKQVIARATKQKCYVLAVTTTPLAWEGNLRIIGNAARIRPALGLHPELVAKRQHEVERFLEILPDTKFVGEIGIDGSLPHRSSIETQRTVFRRILDGVARAGGRIMSIHSRGAEREVLDELEAFPYSGTPILHWFSGSQQELARAVRIGCWFSVGPGMLRGRKGVQLLNKIPADRVLTESDGPFVTNGNSPIFPWQAEEATTIIGKIWNMDPVNVERAMIRNLRSLVSGERSRNP